MPAGRILIILGIILIVAGLLLSSGKLSWLGRLPGDIRIERDNFTVFLPFGTCLLISAVLSLIAWLLKR